MSSDNIESLLANAQELIESVHAKTGAVRAAREARARKDPESRSRTEAARRSGELGREWQLVQQRIDLGKTTMDDVINGVDISPEARALRLTIQKTLPAARAQFAESAEDDPQLLEEVRRSQETLSKSFDGLEPADPNA